MEKKTNEKPVFQEVEVRRILNTKEGKRSHTFERLKVLRENVKITQQQADTLNTGRKEHFDNSIFVMYLKPGEAIEPITLN